MYSARLNICTWGLCVELHRAAIGCYFSTVRVQGLGSCAFNSWGLSATAGLQLLLWITDTKTVSEGT